MTIAMSLLIHGEAVRFNRGDSGGDDFDFKYMRGRDGTQFPYVSSQCYKKYWREALPGPFSPIIREKDAAGKEKNQAYTVGNPIDYLDDDLFGYMIAGATEEADGGDDTMEGGGRLFAQENIKDLKALQARLLDSSAISEFILKQSPTAREILENPDSSSSDLQVAVLDALDGGGRSDSLSNIEGLKGPTQRLQKLPKKTDAEKIQKLNREVLLKTFSKELQETPKRATTRRTAAVRMHALVAFSGIKTARDFQTFSRDVAYSGKDSVLNPKSPGIYSGWLKTRILIESHRIGKFYVGKNMDILEDQAKDRKIETEANPYSREKESVSFVQLDDGEKTKRLRAVLRALADIGNKQGPASGALHDGSLRPKAFVAGIMNCADSPLDYVWIGHNDESMPYLDIRALRDSIEDWKDLFALKKIYVGLPVDAGRDFRPTVTSGAAAAAPALSPAADLKTIIASELKDIGFEAIVDTPRKALLRLAEEAVL